MPSIIFAARKKQKVRGLQNGPGTYALVMRLPVAQSLKIGSLDTCIFESGWYVYVGSAKGGIKSRTGQHLLSRWENAKEPYYHIDYLREAVIEEIWFSYGKASLEHEWSKAIVKHFRAGVPVPGFGSSDCKAGCPAHFFRFTERPVAAVLRSAFKASAKPIHVEFVRSPQRKTVESGYDSDSRSHNEDHMVARKLTEDDVRRSLGPQPMTGRRPNTPKQIDERLQQVVKDSNTWLRLFREAWFYPIESMLDLAVGAGEHPELPEQYDEAIDLMRWIAASAEYGEKKLRQGKQNAIKRLAKKSAQSTPSQVKKKVSRK